MTYNSTNIVNSTYGCNPEAYFTTGDVDMGTANRTITLGSLPAGYSCTNVSWGYSTNGVSGAENIKNGTGCVAANLTVVSGMNNNLWWYLAPNVGSVVGRIRSDANKNGIIEDPSEDWANTASACAGLKHDGFTLREGSGPNLITSYGCDASPVAAYYTTNLTIPTGSHTLTLGGLPPGYVCTNTNVVWGYSTSTGSVNGTGCSPTVTINPGGVNALWWIITKPNTLPTVTLSPTVINHSYAGEFFPVRVGITDPDPYGYLNIKTTLTSGAIMPTYAIRFYAYANRANSGQWPIVRIYGWRKDTGARVAIRDIAKGNATDILIDSTTRKLFDVTVGYTDMNLYSHFDFEFTNDIWEPATSTGTDVYVDRLEFYEDIVDEAYLYSVVQAEDATWVQFDRGDPDDGYDVIKTGDTVSYGPWVPIITGADSYSGMFWGGALRFPVPWVATTGTSGNLTFNVSDDSGVVVSRSVAINAIGRTISGRVWTIPPLTTIDDTYCNNNHVSGGSGTISSGTVTANAGFSSSISGGNYSIANNYGYVEYLTLSNLVSPPGYRIACINNMYSPSTLVTSNFNHTSAVAQTVNIGLRVISAGKWGAAMGSDIFANSILMSIPQVICPATSYMCPDFTNPTEPANFYALGYSAPSSSIFSGEPVSVGPSRLSESNISVTNANTGTGGQKFRKKNVKYLSTTIKSLVEDIAAATTTDLTTIPIIHTMAKDSITVLDKSVNSIPNGFRYSTASGLSFLIVPKNGSTPFVINSVTPMLPGRLVIIANRDIEIGNLQQGTVANVKTQPSHIVASIITTGNITIQNYPATSSSSPGGIMIDGPLISGGNITMERNLGPIYNESRPSLFVKFNPFYLTELNKIALANSIPALNPLFVFDFSQKDTN